jgi:hypothetical protein
MPPKAPTKNTATREYYEAKTGTDSPPSETDFAWPDSAPSSPKPERESPKEDAPAAPSPTPSDIVIAAELEDFRALAEMNSRMVKEGVGAKERKERLVVEEERLGGEWREKEAERKRVEEERVEREVEDVLGKERGEK